MDEKLVDEMDENLVDMSPSEHEKSSLPGGRHVATSLQLGGERHTVRS